MDKWTDFYKPFFESDDKAQAFVESCEALRLDEPKHPAKIMMHQTQRLISLSDELLKIQPGRESLQLLFLLICAEHIAKLHANYDKEGRSRTYVQQFFSRFLTIEQQDRLRSGFSHIDLTPLKLQEVIDLLYDVRCDVVHEGRYWEFHFHDGTTPMQNAERGVNVNISLSDLKTLIVKGCIEAVKTYPGPH